MVLSAPSLPVNNDTSLNLVFVRTLLICVLRASISVLMFFLSLAEYVPFEDCTVSSRMRWSMLLTSSSAPSAVCAIEMPSLALRMPWFIPRICAVIELLMARPAASSFAELMRLPVDKRSMAVESADCALAEALLARSDEMLLFITVIDRSFVSTTAPPPPERRAEPSHIETAAPLRLLEVFCAGQRRSVIGSPPASFAPPPARFIRNLPLCRQADATRAGARDAAWRSCTRARAGRVYAGARPEIFCRPAAG